MGEGAVINRRNEQQAKDDCSNASILDFKPFHSRMRGFHFFAPCSTIDWLPAINVREIKETERGGFEIIENGRTAFSYGPNEGFVFTWPDGQHLVVVDQKTNTPMKAGIHEATFRYGYQTGRVTLSGEITREIIYDAYKSWKETVDQKEKEIDAALSGFSEAEQSALKRLLSEREGNEFTAYLDSRRIPTVGVGFNLLRPDARARLESMGVNYDELLRSASSKDESSKPQLTQEQIDKLFDRTLKESVVEARKIYPGLDTMPQNVRQVCIDLVFNMGADNVREFRRFNQAVNSGNYQLAARHLGNSEYANQLPGRSRANIAMLRNSGPRIVLASR